MKNTISKFSPPVVTFLSPSASASRKAQSLLASLCGLEKIPLHHFNEDDNLNTSFASVIPAFSKSFDSVAIKCPSTGTLIHLLSEDRKSGDNSKKQQPFSMLAITDSSNDSSAEAVQKFRDLFAMRVKERASSIKVKAAFTGGLTTEELLRDVSSGGLPLLSLPSPEKDLSRSSPQTEDQKTGIKEIVVPYFDFSEYKEDGSTFLSHFSQSKRPVVGVYQWGSSSTRIRPLPTASEDRRLPPPSLIFRCNDLEDIEVGDTGAKTAKIGFGGNLSRQQLMLQHQDLFGLDVRFCSSTTVSSAFSEAQDSLLAASLGELQSANTLLAGGEKVKDDDRILNSDCWVEVRATLKEPSGFLKRSPGLSSSSKRRIASAVNTPDS